MWEQVKQALLQSIQRVVFKVATLLPGVVALVVALVVFTGIGWLLALIVRRFLLAIEFDSRVKKWGIADLSNWSDSTSPTVVVTRIVFWATFLVGLFVGIAAFDASTANGLSVYIVGYLSKIVAAVVLLLIGIICARFFSRSVLINGVNMNLQHARLLSLGVKWLVMVFTAAMILDHLGIARVIVDLGFGILFGGIVLAMTLAVGLGSRDLVSRSLERESNPAPQEEDVVRHF